MARTSIEWTKNGFTWNPTAGCSSAGPECLNCYAVKMTKRLAAMGQSDYEGLVGVKHFNGTMRMHAHKLDIPLKRKKPTTWFVNSMSDLFHAGVPFEFIDRVFAVMALTPQHTYQVLTKRPERMAEYLAQNRPMCLHEVPPGAFSRLAGPKHPLHNVWLGTSVGVRKAKHRIDALCNVPATIRFLSLEPLLEDLGELDLTGIDWVILGAESGPKRRRMEAEWAESIAEKCRLARVPFFMKQMEVGGRIEHEVSNFPERLRVRQYPEARDARP